MINKLKTKSLEDLQMLYKEYLLKQNFAESTIQTSLSDAFYIWRKRDFNLFWKIVDSDDFEEISRITLMEILNQESGSTSLKNINNYRSHLRRFRKFIQDENYNTNIDKTEVNEEAFKINRNKSALPYPTVDQVKYYLEKWNNLEDYQVQEEALNHLFIELKPKNKNLKDILIKASILNDFYSTNIFKVFPVAKHILSLDIDNRLREGDISLVEDLKKVTIDGKTRNLYSFATKYCSHHNPLNFPIYDSYVDKVLIYFRNEDKFSTFKNLDLKDYMKFYSILEEFRIFYNLQQFSFKELDKYLWQLGKNYFSLY